MKKGTIRKWLNPGLYIKRWIFLGILGLLIFSSGFTGVVQIVFQNLQGNLTISVFLIILGVILMIIGIRKSFNAVLEVLYKNKSYGDVSKEKINELIYREKILNKGPKIVVIGGGTGLSVFLRGLKKHTTNITAIVTVADDGGGSGKLREDLGMLPPGDIRSCILALANTEPSMEKILQYRFKEGSLKGQSFGNLFMAAMNEAYGNFEKAIKEMSNVLAVTGKVLPMTLEDVTLYAKLENGDVITGESNIPKKSEELGSRIENVFIKPRNPKPLDEVLKEIKSADCIILGPGSLYTSVIPNLLTKDIAKEIQNAKAIKVYVSNVMTQPGETDGYSVLDHIEAINKVTKKDLIDYVITNTESIPEETLKEYNKDGAKQLIITEDEEEILRKQNINVIKDNLIDIKKDYIRHNAEKLSEIIVDLTIKKLEEERIEDRMNRGRAEI